MGRPCLIRLSVFSCHICSSSCISARGLRRVDGCCCIFKAQGHGFEVDGEARPLCPWGMAGEAGGKQGLQA